MQVKVPRLPKLPYPKGCDFLALALFGASLALAAAHLVTTRSALGAMAFLAAQIGICVSSLLALGWTVREGTPWGILGALLGSLTSLAGVLLAAALWALA